MREHLSRSAVAEPFALDSGARVLSAVFTAAILIAPSPILAADGSSDSGSWTSWVIPGFVIIGAIIYFVRGRTPKAPKDPK